MNLTYRKRALRIALAYALFSGTWILISDQLLHTVIFNVQEFARWEIYKGWVFVVVTALLLYLERRKSEVRLGESEEKYRSLAETSRDLILAADPDGHITYLNRAGQETSGYSQTELSGKTVDDLFPGSHIVASTFRIPPQSPEGNVPYRLEASLRTRDGRSIIMDLTASELARRGERAGILVAGRDMSERYRSQEALRQSEERMRMVVTNTPVVFFALDLTGKFLVSEGKGLAALGLRPGEVVGKSVFEVYRDAPEVLKAVRQALTGEEVDLIVEVGGLVFETRYSPLRDSTGRCIGSIGIATDVTKHQSAEKRNREQAELLDITADAVIVESIAGGIGYWNKGATRLYDWAFKDVQGRRLQELFAHPPSTDFLEIRRKILAEGEWRGELIHETKSKHLVTVDSRCVLVSHPPGNPQSILMVNTDVTQKKELEAQFFQAQRMESLGTLAGGIAHDLNNVLTPILLSMEVLKHRVTDGRSQRVISTIEATAERGRSIIKQVLTFARGVKGEQGEIRLQDVVREIEHIMRETFPRAIHIETAVSNDLWTVSGDATQLHQVLLNLCVNARDAMPAGGTLKVVTENVEIDAQYAKMNIEMKPGLYAVITVSDTGIGIPPENRSKIFEPFFTTKEVGRGTGLGLSTVHTIVKSHGGFMSVYSEVGHGTTMRVYLPARREAVSPADLIQPEELQRGDGEMILIVDDEESIRDAIRESLEMFGYRVLAARDGTEAIALYVQHKADINIVITDLMMPHMGGVATIRALRTITQNLTIIASSGLARNDPHLESEHLQIQGYLQKPFTTDRLLKTIYNARRATILKS